MTPAQKYIAGLYEQAIDLGLDVAQVAEHLASRGIRRSVFQVTDEIERVYGFHGYGASHPAPPFQTLAQIDRQFD